MASLDVLVRQLQGRLQLESELITSLPAGPSDGQVCHVQAAAGVIWTFRYNAASASPYKWEFVGGPPLFAEVATREPRSVNSYADLATVGPSITLPALAGDYDIEIGCGTYNSTNAGAYGYMSYSIGGAAAADLDAYKAAPDAANVGVGAGSRMRRKTGIAASSAIVAKYQAAAGTSQFENRWMRISPVRVG